MTPEFTPPKSNLPMTPVYLAAVRPKMIESAASVADGLRLHGFCTKKYLQDVVTPAIDRGLESSGRSRSEIDICGGGFIMTGPDEETVAKNREWVRYRIAFYGSTRTYEPVMALHGWNDLAAKLHHMSKTGQWKQMAAEIPDEVLDEFGVYATYDDLPRSDRGALRWHFRYRGARLRRGHRRGFRPGRGRTRPSHPPLRAKARGGEVALRA